MNLSDSELVRAVRQRADQGAFKELLLRYENIILSVVKRYAGPRFPHEDLYQEASIGLWEACRAHRSDMVISFAGLAKRRATFRAVDFIRANRTVVTVKNHDTTLPPDLPLAEPGIEALVLEMADGRPSPENIVAAKVARRKARAVLARAIEGMSEDQRAVIVYRTLQPKATLRDAATVLGCAPSTAMLREQKAFAWMQARLAGHFNAPDTLADLCMSL